MTLEEQIAGVVRAELRPLLERLERLLGEAKDELLTPAEAARLAKVKPAALRAWARLGALRVRGSARAPRYLRSEVLAVRVEPKEGRTAAAVAERILRRCGGA